MNEVISSILERRSVRKYQQRQISEEELKTVLEAGKYAACGMGIQAETMVVVQDKETLAQLSAMNAAIMGKPGTDPFYGAPTAIIVLVERAKKTAVQDGSLVMGNLMLAAHAIGLGSCWINRAFEEFESPEGKALLQKWGLNGDYIGVGHCILGYPEGPLPAAKPRRANTVVRV